MSWTFAAPQRTPVHGGRDFPSVRYSAAAVEYRGEMIVTHGYFYNHAIRHPAWQSNAWAFNFGSRKWRLVHDGERAGAPSARYSVSAVLYQDALWMFGGDDGGHKKSMFNYIFQAWYNELWRMDLRTYTWRKIAPNNDAPVKRALHSAVVVGDSMYVYGGLELADTWRYDFGPNKWTLLVPPPADSDTRDGSHPGRRHAFAAAATQNGMFIFGGCRHVRGQRPMAFDDLWRYHIGSNTWRLIAPATNPASSLPMPHPSARSHLSLVPLTDHLILLYGGALCIPGCSCHGDTWIYDARLSQWTQINATDAPIHRYRQSLVVHGAEGALYLYGGESYQPYMYHNAVNRLQLPHLIASETIAFAGRVGGGGGRHSHKKLANGGRSVAEVPTSTAAAKAKLSYDDEEPGVLAAATMAAGHLHRAVGALGDGSAVKSGQIMGIPLVAMFGGFAIWAIRNRQKRARSYKYKAVEDVLSTD